MAEYTGSALYLKFGSTVLNTDFRKFNPDEKGDTVDASAGADTDRSYLTTLKHGTAKAHLVDQSAGTALWTALKPLTSGTLEWGEEGTASTKPKHTVTAIVTGRTKDEPYDGIVTIDVDFLFNSAVTDTVY